MASLLRTTVPRALRCSSLLARRPLLFLSSRSTHDLHNPPQGHPPVTGRSPPGPPREEASALRDNSKSGSYLGTTKRLPEFNLNDKVILVTGAARGLGLVQAEALLEAGATVYALDRLGEPSPDFYRVQKRAAEELGTTLHYRQIDVRDVEGLNRIVKSISDGQGKLDGLIAAAGIQQETPALEYTAKDANTMFEVSVSGSVSGNGNGMHCSKLEDVADPLAATGQHHRRLHDRASRRPRDDPARQRRQHRHDRLHVRLRRQPRKLALAPFLFVPTSTFLSR